ncbi:sialidase family protein [Tenacibaculum maritimum]|uniref:sialidase family protein n=1 Tax=Tenacibaculum maritimum TaxID=107401 RepID=UPI003875C84D
MRFFLMSLFIGVIFLSCSEDSVIKHTDDTKNSIKFNDIIVSDLKETNVNEDHVSEGIMVTLSNGDILNFYRNDPQKEGNHIGNSGRIVKRKSSDGGETWENEVVVFSDQYDDRNIRGGITDEGYIILFFRRFNAENRATIDLNYIISFDNGVSWTERKVIEFDASIAEEVWFDNIINLKNGKYLMPIHGISYCEVRYLSIVDKDIRLSEKKWSWDYTGNSLMKIDEPMFTYLGDGNIIGLFRDDSKEKGSNYLQVTSSNYGQTWTQPDRTNICKPLFSPSPLIFYDDKIERLIVVGTDRRQPRNGGHKQRDAEIWVYVNKIEEVFNKPKNYNLIKRFSRPKPENYQFYGYPCYAKKNNKKSEFLIVVSDSYNDGVNEDSDHYQFKISFE